MRNRLARRRLALALVVAAGLALAWWLWTKAEPQYLGRPASEYVQAVLATNFLSTATITNALFPMGAEVAVPAIARMLAREDSQWEHTYRSLQKRLPPVMRKRLPRPAASPEQLVRHAAMALMTFGTNAESAIATLAESYERTDAFNQQMIAGNLTRLGPAAHDAIPALLRKAREPRTPTSRDEGRSSAIRALAQVDPTGRASALTLIPLLNDSNATVVAATVDALGRMARSTRTLIPNLREALKHSGLIVCLSAARHLNELDALTRADLEPFVQRLRSSNPETRVFGATVLIHGSAFARDVVPALMGVVADENPKVREAALNSLEYLAASERVPLTLRLKATKTLLQFGAPSQSWNAMNWLPVLVPEVDEIVPYLIAALENPDERTRGKAALTLGQMGPAAKESVPALQRRLSDEWLNVREAVTNALRAIDSAER